MAEPESQYKELRAGFPLNLREGACLALLSPRYATCRACEAICPVRAIHVSETALTLDESCLNCARCAAACPMGALETPGFAVADIAQEATHSIAVDCWKVPRDISPEGAVRVPCLGGLSAGRINDLVALAGQRPVVLLDRGWCSQCSAGGGGDHPASAALNSALSLLEKAGMATGELPWLELMPLPDKYLPADIPNADTQQQLSRRAFFGALLGKSAAAIGQAQHLTGKSELRRKRGFELEPVSSRERDRVLHSMQRITRRTGHPLPPELFYRLEISDACRNHLLCAKVCPTGALDIHEEENYSGLTFDGSFCIGCGHCVTVCPNEAIQLLPNGNNPLPVWPVQLTRFGEQSCAGCGRSYPASSGEEICPQCLKRRQLSNFAFHTLFGEER